MNAIYENQQRREAEEKRRLQALLEDSDFKAVIETPEGRRFLRRLLAECGIHRSTFAESDRLTAFLEGKRTIGLWLQNLFANYPEIYIQMLREDNDVDQSN